MFDFGFEYYIPTALLLAVGLTTFSGYTRWIKNQKEEELERMHHR